MLCTIPNEVLGLVARYCEPPDLCALSRTCKLLQSHAQPALYRDIVLSKGDTERALGKLSCDVDVVRKNCIPNDVMLYRRRSELLKLTRRIDVTLPWSIPNSPHTCRVIRTINEMPNLRHMSILYIDQVEYNDGLDLPFHDLHLPSDLSAALTTCTVGFKDWGNWSFRKATCLFYHPSIRHLNLHWASSDEGFPLVDMGKNRTNLETLSLIDCKITSNDLYQLLGIPLALQYLTIASNFNDYEIYSGEQINCTDYFNSIQRACGKSLKGLRFDTTHWGNIIVPAPGMHQLPNVKYLELAPDHLEEHIEELNNPQNIPAPDIDCPLEQLLPPNLEVLKVMHFASDFAILWHVLARKSELVPRLRKIILTVHYRNRHMKNKLLTALRKREDTENFPELLEDDETLADMYPCVSLDFSVDHFFSCAVSDSDSGAMSNNSWNNPFWKRIERSLLTPRL